jgi:hypothetical protein
MNKRNRLTIGLIAVIALACACPATSLPGINEQPATGEPPVVSTIPVIPTSTPIPTNVLYNDDFSVESAEMETFTDENGSAGTRDGVYFIQTTGEKWHWGRSDSEFDNTVIEFDVAMFAGPSNDNAGFGVICRLTVREDTSVDGYLLAISADGFYTIRSITAGSMTPLVDWSYSDAIRHGSESNKVRATCNGSDLTLEVNNQIIASSALALGSTSGAIAFAAISFEDSEPLVEAHFDNLVVSKP